MEVPLEKLASANLLSQVEPAKQYTLIYPRLIELYPTPQCGLIFKNPFQLLVATILSAQCTDVRVNLVTPALFAEFSDATTMAEADLAEVEKLIYSTGFYHNKARNIIGSARMITENYNGRVPDTMTELLQLPGVARKTASVVLGNAYNKNEGIAVDTHVTRLSGRLGFSFNTTPEKIEQDLMQLAPRSEWTNLSHRLIWHGRLICKARKPHCQECKLADVCPSYKSSVFPK